ncbi:hypothetical protein FXO38_12092 [Capsicum annuum]|nr:hypothetical protein FXO38_12092 [Capsicum annuum]
MTLESKIYRDMLKYFDQACDISLDTIVRVHYVKQNLKRRGCRVGGGNRGGRSGVNHGGIGNGRSGQRRGRGNRLGKDTGIEQDGSLAENEQIDATLSQGTLFDLNVDPNLELAGIALEAAHGIAYLHAQWPSVSHDNIKSSNISLTKSHEAPVSDFCLAQLVDPSTTPNRIAGYRAPEVTDPRKVSHKVYVYSFGILLLELLTGKVPTYSTTNEDGVDLLRWVQSVVREEWTIKVFDLEFLRYQNIEKDMVQLLQRAVDCTARYPDRRTSIPEITSRIEELFRMNSGGGIIDNTDMLNE